MILLPLMLIWLRAPMHFPPPARWSVVAWAICIAVSSGAAEGTTPLRGWESVATGGSLEIASLTSEPLAPATPSRETPAPRQDGSGSSAQGPQESQKNQSPRNSNCAAIPAAKDAAEAAMLALRSSSLPLVVPLWTHPPRVCLVRSAGGN